MFYTANPEGKKILTAKAAKHAKKPKTNSKWYTSISRKRFKSGPEAHGRSLFLYSYCFFLAALAALAVHSYFYLLGVLGGLGGSVLF